MSNQNKEKNAQLDDSLFDNEGFVIKFEQWDESLAEIIAANESVQLTDTHWNLIRLVRIYYQEFDNSPAMRPLIKFLKGRCPDLPISSGYLLQLFPNSPAKLMAKIAGLPKPENCL